MSELDEHEGTRRLHELGLIPGSHAAEGVSRQVFADAVLKDSDQSRQGRAIWLGDSRVGKTSTIRAVVGEPHDPHEPSTVGLSEAVVDVQEIDVDRWTRKPIAWRAPFERAAAWSAAQRLRALDSSGYSKWWHLVAALAVLLLLAQSGALLGDGCQLSDASLGTALCILAFLAPACPKFWVLVALPSLAAGICEVTVRGSRFFSQESLSEIPWLPLSLAVSSALWIVTKRKSLLVGCWFFTAAAALMAYAADFRPGDSSQQVPCFLRTAPFSMATLLYTCTVVVLVCAGLTSSSPGLAAALCLLKFHWYESGCVALARTGDGAIASILGFALGVMLGLNLVGLTNILAKLRFIEKILWLKGFPLHTILLTITLVLTHLLANISQSFDPTPFRHSLSTAGGHLRKDGASVVCISFVQAPLNLTTTQPIGNISSSPAPPLATLADIFLSPIGNDFTNSFLMPILCGIICASVSAYSLKLIRHYFLNTPLAGKKIEYRKEKEPAHIYTVLMLFTTASTAGLLALAGVQLVFSSLTVLLATMILLTGHDLCIPRLIWYGRQGKPPPEHPGVVDLDQERSHHLGAEMERYNWEKRDLPNFQMDFLDFAGHPLYDNVHHLYLTDNDIFLLVFNLHEAATKGTPWQIERLTHWLSSIYSKACSAGSGTGDVMALLVGTNRDNPRVTEEWLRQFRRKLDEQLGLHEMYGTILVRRKGEREPMLVPVENSRKNDPAARQLRQELLRVMNFKREKQLHSTQNRWLWLSHRLNQRVTTGLHCVPMEILLEESDRCSVPADELPMAIKQLSKIGHLVHLPRGSGLSSDIILLKPAILCTLLGHLQDVVNPKVNREWVLLRKTGLATRAMLEVLFEDVEMDLSLIIGMLATFHLVCPLKEAMLPPSPADRFLFPCYLPEFDGHADEMWSSNSDGLHEEETLFDFGAFDPAPLFSQLLAVALETYTEINPGIIDATASNVCRTAAVLAIDEDEQLFLHCDTVSSTQHLIRVCSRQSSQLKRPSACSDMCQQLIALQQSQFAHLAYHAGQPCPLPPPHEQTAAGDHHVLPSMASAQRSPWEERNTRAHWWCRGRKTTRNEVMRSNLQHEVPPVFHHSNFVSRKFKYENVPEFILKLYFKTGQIEDD